MLVVFDLDGTLIDSLRDLADSANEMLAGYGGAPVDEGRIGQMVGGGASVLVARVLAAAGVEAAPAEALSRFLAIYDRRLLNHSRPYPGIADVLAELSSRVTLGLLTNRPLDQSVVMLDAFGFTKYFPHQAGGDGPWPRKPAPDGLRWLMERAGDTPGRTLLVGDSLVDLMTARGAGAGVCLARYGFGFGEIPADALTGGEWVAETPLAIPGIVTRSIGGATPAQPARA
jgi:phosphoglycolate phosphatase